MAIEQAEFDRISTEAFEWAKERFGNEYQMKELGEWPTSNRYKKVHTPLMYMGMIQFGRLGYSDAAFDAWFKGLNKLSDIAQNRAMGLPDDDES